MTFEDDDITAWIERLREGDERAPQAIWEAYFSKLVALSRRKLASIPAREADGEDVALSALNSFYHGVANDRFPKLDDRHDLWRLLVTITIRKAVTQKRRYYAQKRGGGLVRGESVFLRHANDSQADAGIHQVLGTDPTPELAQELADDCGELLGRLDERLRPIALAKMEGYSNLEIAEQLDLALRTVERRLEQIREIWSPAGDAPQA